MRRKMRALQSDNLRTVVKQIRSDPHAVYSSLKGRPKPLPMSMQTAGVWDPYVQRLAACELEEAPPPPLNPAAPPFQPAHAAASIPPAVEAALQQLNCRRSQAATLNDAFTPAEVQAALQNLNNNKAPGACGQPAELLRYATLQQPDGKVANVLLPALTAMLNAAFLSGEVPDNWNVNLVTPIYKKGDATDTSNYRPIAVGEPVIRLLAILINTRLVDYTEAHDLRSTVQAGFRPALSCQHALMALQHFIDMQVQHCGQQFYCFVDLKGAYDNVPRRHLWRILTGLGLHGNMSRGIKAMY